MKKEEIVNRLSGLFDQGRERMHEVRDDMEERFRTGAEAVTARAREGWSDGRERFLDAEQRMVRTVRENQTVFLLAGLSLLGLVLAKLLYDRQKRQPF